MRTIVIRIPRLEFSAEMAAMRKWLAKHRCEPLKFISHRYANLVSVYVQFENNSEADAFKARFKVHEGQPESDTLPLLQNEYQWSLGFHYDISGQTRGTVEQACSWRLKAEEVRTQAEALSSAEARNTMKTVAETWDQMAEDLERRLARNPRDRSRARIPRGAGRAPRTA